MIACCYDTLRIMLLLVFVECWNSGQHLALLYYVLNTPVQIYISPVLVFVIRICKCMWLDCVRAVPKVGS